MKAAVQYAPFDVRLEEVPVPVIKPGEVLVKIKAAGICGSDVHFFEGSHPYKMYPRIHGHELAGEIDQVGEGVSKVLPGDRVVIEPLLACGTCFPCRKGKYNCCVSLEVIGAHMDGGFSDYLAVPANKVHLIPEGMPVDLAATAEPYTIGNHSTSGAKVSAGDTVLILGAGAIGLTAIDFAKIAGARVLVAEMSEFRKEMVLKFGADFVIDPSKEDLLARVMEITNNEGAGIVIEATGVRSVMENTENLVAAGGTIVIAGLTNEKVAFTGINFTKREMNILGTRNSAGEFPAVIDAIASGKTHADLLITKKFTFSQIVEALEYTTKNMANEGKVIIEF